MQAIWAHERVTFAVNGSEWSALRPGRLSSRKIVPISHSVEDWVDPEMDRNFGIVKNFLPFVGNELRFLGCPAVAGLQLNKYTHTHTHTHTRCRIITNMIGGHL